jgi:glycosyltransferase involved in cell wall biosynthesis
LLANVVHTDLNYHGGSERLAIATILALSNMGMDVELTLLKRPSLLKLDKIYGKTATSILKGIKKVNILRSYARSYSKNNHVLTINTAADILPYFSSDFSMNNAIVYCHFPSAIYRMESRDPNYIQFLNQLNLSSIETFSRGQDYLKLVSNTFLNMMLNSEVLTNSQYSRNAISKEFGVDSTVVNPPVDVDTFRNNSLYSNHRKEVILVVSRFHPIKKVENALRLAKALKFNKIGTSMKIIGTLAKDCLGYYLYLKRMIKKHNLADYVTLETNIKFNTLLEAMHGAMIYFHTFPGEPFGISTVEAMSAGLVPVVPDIGGHTEFVPVKYQFHTLGEAVEVVASALDVSLSERVSLSDSVRKYSIQNYIERFQQICDRVNIDRNSNNF